MMTNSTASNLRTRGCVSKTRRTNPGIVCSFDARVESTCSATLRLVIAREALPGFDTLQTVYFHVSPRSQICWCREWWCDGGGIRTI